MIATTRWRDTNAKSLEKSINNLISEVISDDANSNIVWENWKLEKKFDENEKISLNGHEIEYNYVNYSFDQRTIGDLSDDRLVKREGFVIIYSKDEKINYIIDQNTSALKLLRKLLSYTGKNEIEMNSFNFTNDFFMWLIYRVYYNNAAIEISPTDKNLRIDAIKGFKGSTEDLQTKVSATGETVMNIISTLSFLLESSKLNQIKLDVACRGHTNISLILKKQTVSISLPDYSGTFESERSEELQISKLYLMIYMEILPMLIQEYNTDIANKLWSKVVNIEFMKDIGEKLREEIQVKISSL